MTDNTEKIINEMITRAPDGETDRNKLRALLRRRVIEAVESQFKEGLEFSDLGAVLPPERMIDLIANSTENGYPVTW